jgi:type IV secretion system protein VirB2
MFTNSYALYGPANSLEAAMGWIQALLLGQLGTTIAVLAVAFAGFNMLWGRLSPKDGLRVILGCFILFGAPAIAQGLVSAVQGSAQPEVIASSAPAPAPVLAPKAPPPPNINPFDPYTGARPAN